MKNSPNQGIVFVKENLQKGLIAARKSQSVSYLEKVLRREEIRLSAISKTGDLYRYFKRFSSRTHRHALEFTLLAKESKGAFIPLEEMAKYLADHFPKECEDLTLLSDFEYGKAYQNDFLSVVLGGNYARSFRFSKDLNVAYLVVNNYIGPNKWEDDDTFVYRLHNQFQKGSPTCERIFDKYRSFRVLIFQKRQRNELVYLGVFRMADIEKDGTGLIFKRIEHVPNRGSYERNDDRVSPNIWNILPSGSNPVDAVTCALTEIAKENGIEYSLNVLTNDDMPRSVLLSFADGFYELLGTYDSCAILVLNDTVLSKTRKEFVKKNSPSSRTIFVIDCTKYEADGGSELYFRRLGWNVIENKISEISSANEPLSIIKDHQIYPRKREPTLLTDSGKGRIAIYRFLIDALSQDYLQQNEIGLREDVVAEKRLQMPDGKTVSIDLAMHGYYGRLDIESPIFEIKFRFNKSIASGYLNQFSDFVLCPIVFIDISGKKSFKTVIGGKEYLVLGQPFIAQLARLYPDIYRQYVLEPEEMVPQEKSNSEESRTLPTPISTVLDNNFASFKELIANSNQHISVIAGNGVSIPFGTDTWSDMTSNILMQLQPGCVDSYSSAGRFFGDISLATNDFAKFTLLDNGAGTLYWNAIKYSIYRRYNRLTHDQDSSIKAICQAKHKYWDRLSLFTYNYDTFIENQFEHDYGPAMSLTSAINDECDAIPTATTDIVIHAHGRFLEGKDKGEDIILTRSEYFEEYRSMLRPQLTKLRDALKHDICLFVGSSMTDIFQLTMIEDNSKQYGDDSKPWIYALLPVGRFKEKEEKTLKSLYEYFLKKDVLVISFDEFKDIPELIRKLFLI